MKPVKVITYGRSSQNERSFPSDPKMSRVHCQILKYDTGVYQIIDFGSANGTWVNGRCIQKNMLLTLQPTDVVRIGETTLRWMDDFSSTSSGASYGGSYNGGYSGGGSNNGGYVNDGGNSVGNSGGGEGPNNAIWVFLMGLVAIGIIAYLIIDYATATETMLLRNWDFFKGFVTYLHGVSAFGVSVIGAKWVPIIAAIVIGGLADLVDSLVDSEGGLKTAGLWFANVAVVLGTICLFLTIFAKEIVGTGLSL